MKPTFICYSKCSTCQKARKWLAFQSIEVEERDIVTQNPTIEELTRWIKMSELPISKTFNTSGLKYRELGIKDIVKNATEQELIKILASDGMLVKRPILITDKTVLFGFNEELWKTALHG